MSVIVPPALRHAWRSLRRTPVFTLTAALTLVIGMGAAVAIFALVNGVLLRPLPYGDPGRLVGVWHDLPPLDLTKANQTAATYFTYKRLARTLDGIGVYQNGAANVAASGGGEPQRLPAAFISVDIIPVLDVEPLLGRPFSEDEDRPGGTQVVMISEGLWRSRFGADPAALGRTIEVNGITREIVAVMPHRFRFPSAETRLWIPLRLDPANPFPGGFSYNSVARLLPGVSVDAARRDLESLLPRVAEMFPNLAPGVSTQMLMDQARPTPVLIPLHEDVTSDIATTLWMVAAAALLVLIVACANVTNLILVRADGRQRELAVREALGAGRARVMMHFLAESAVLTAIAGVFALGVAWLAVRALVAAGPEEIPRLAEVSVDGAAVLFAVGLVVLVAAACALMPALRIGRVHLFDSLREGGRGGTAGKARQRVRGALVAGQIALALVVLACSGLLVRSFQRLHAVPPGFDPENVATLWLSLPSARYPNDSASVRFYTQLIQRVAELPGVRSAGLSSRLPLMESGMNQNPFYPEGDATYENRIPPLQIYKTTDGGYFETLRIPVVAGRTFDRLDLQRGGEAIISQATAEQFWQDATGQRALGKRFRPLPGGPWYTVVGVVGNARDTSLAGPPSQIVYFPQAVEQDTTYSQAARTMAVVVRSDGDLTAITRAVQGVMRELDPTLPTFNVQSMRAVYAASMARLTFMMVILAAAAVVTLTLGAIGLYGVMAYVVTLRARELSVRIALGAQPRAVAAMMTRQGIALTVVGIAAGLALFAGVARFVRSFLFEIAPGDPLTLVGASVMLVMIAAFASWVPARRASRADPAEVLRAE